jgi:hypothetical protein
MADIKSSLTNILYAFLLAIILSSVLLGFRASALKNAYDVTNATTITDSSGTVHQVEASPIDGDLIALLYMIGVALVWIAFVIFMILSLIKGIGG